MNSLWRTSYHGRYLSVDRYVNPHGGSAHLQKDEQYRLFSTEYLSMGLNMKLLVPKIKGLQVAEVPE